MVMRLCSRRVLFPLTYLRRNSYISLARCTITRNVGIKSQNETTFPGGLPPTPPIHKDPPVGGSYGGIDGIPHIDDRQPSGLGSRSSEETKGDDPPVDKPAGGLGRGQTPVKKEGADAVPPPPPPKGGPAPKDGQDPEKKKSNEKKTEDEKPNDNKTTTDQYPSNTTRMFNTFVGTAIGFALFYYLSKDITNENKEITFHDFLNKYLTSPQLDHLEYDLHTKLVKVYLNKNNTSNPDKEATDLNQVSDSLPKQIGTQSKATYDYFFHTLGIEDFETKMMEAEIDKHILPSHAPKIIYTGQMNFDPLLGPIISVGILALLLWPALRRRGGSNRLFGGLMDITKSKDPTTANITTTFKDVAGMEEAKLEITEFVSFLTNPEKYKQLGAKIPRGAILFGPPGTGKTLLAKAVAGESKVPFFSISGSDFVEMFVGVGPARVRDLFAKARKHKTAIIYIDEIDAIGRPRGLNSMYGGGNDERENTLNQLLVEMDGFTENSGVVMMASTNVDPEGLDPALLRPGRFDRQIVVDKPDQKEREQIFNVHMQKLKLSEDVKKRVSRLAELTPGFSGADIANVCNEGGIFAARQNKTEVEMVDMEKAIERVIGGIEKRNLPISKEERNVIAYHEAGHAIVSWFSRFCDPLLKVSIIPRGNALGYAQYVPKERFIRTYDQLVELIAQALGGRVAEKIVFGHLSTGAKDDLQKITQIAYAAVSTFGMNTDIGPLSYPIPGDPSISVQKPYSDYTAEVIDVEVRKLIDEVFAKTERLLTEKRNLLEAVAQYLIKNEVMNLEQFRDIVGPRPYPSVKAEGPKMPQTIE